MVDLDVARILGDSMASSIRRPDFDRAESPRRRREASSPNCGSTPSSYGGWNLTRGQARASIAGSRMAARLRLATGAGTLEVDSLVGRWEEGGVFRLIGARFHDLDLAQLTSNPDQSSSSQER
jgi:hypothetical protein